MVKLVVVSYPGIEGCHDLIIHNYGPNRNMATIHAEIANDTELEKAHGIIDQIEQDALEKLGILLVIHIDPVEIKDQTVLRIRHYAQEELKRLEPMASIHDFRMEEDGNRVLVNFDMLVPYGYSEQQKEDLKNRIFLRIKTQDNRYHCSITVEHGFKGVREEDRRPKLNREKEADHVQP